MSISITDSIIPAFFACVPIDSESIDDEEGESAFIPSSSGELLLTAVLVIPAVLFLVYATVALYHCVCSRNYAEWRASWWGSGKDGARDETSQVRRISAMKWFKFSVSVKDSA